ncbi:MAG: (Fe-S)-binding protein, partial [Parasporobacterium sp.]|nr:(Fe-S)-binding protein [Parasporobacterium sp.]
MALKDYRPMQERCSNCLNCKWIPFDKVQSMRFGENCPSVCFNNFNTYSARGRFQLGQSILDGRADYSDETTYAIHACMACGACDVSCKVCRYNLEPLNHNIELKHSAVEHGKTLCFQTEMIDSLNREKTMLMGKGRLDRNNWLEPVKDKVVNAMTDEADIIFFPGCKYSYDKRLQKEAVMIVDLLVEAGIKVGVLGNADMCCAGRAYQMG